VGKCLDGVSLFLVNVPNNPIHIQEFILSVSRIFVLLWQRTHLQNLSYLANYYLRLSPLQIILLSFV
jgi:hypothetical protein